MTTISPSPRPQSRSTRRRWSVSVGLCMLGGLLMPGRVAGQVVISPFVGVYVPTSNIYQEPGTLETGRQTTAFAGGLRLTVSATGSLGLEGSVAFVPSDVEVTSSSGVVRLDAKMWMGSLRAVLVLNSAWAAVNVYFAAGGSVVVRTGEAFQNATGTTDWGGNIALGALFRLNQSVRVRLEMEDYLYSTQFAFPAGTTQSRFQNDLVFTLALSLPIAG